MKEVKIITNTELLKKGTKVIIMNEHGDKKYRVRTKNGTSYIVNKTSIGTL